ncbi:MAG TPA: hypothetical protein VML94_00650 [Thermoplasmata archaeon]|nr:hypothetical protein [Thermoplasmata archaeon]
MGNTPATGSKRILGPSVRLQEKAATGSGRCRCGTRLAGGSTVVVIVGSPESIEFLVGDRSFCSARCVRAYLLEELAAVESMATPHASQTISDLRGVFLDLSRTFAELYFDLTSPQRQ